VLVCVAVAVAVGIPLGLKDADSSKNPKYDFNQIRRTMCNYVLCLTDDQYHVMQTVCTSINREHTDLINDYGPFPQVERAVVAIHGSEYNPIDFANWMKDAAVKAGVDNGTTAIFAPMYNRLQDLWRNGLIEESGFKFLYWSGTNYQAGWAAGAYSMATDMRDRFLLVRSFEALEVLLLDMSNCTKYPHLKQISLVGWGSGATFLNGYIGYSSVLSDFNKSKQYNVQVVLAAQGMFMYYDGDRAVQGTGPNYQFVPPNDPKCSAYNQFPLGPTWDMNVQSNIKAHTGLLTTHLVGSDDKAAVPVATCDLRYQGNSSVEKQQVWQAYLTSKGNLGLTSFMVLEGLGHDAQSVMLSQTTADLIFRNPRMPWPSSQCKPGDKFSASNSLPVKKYRYKGGTVFDDWLAEVEGRSVNAPADDS